MKHIMLAAAGAALVGLTACSQNAALTAAVASPRSVRVPVSCSQDYNTWTQEQGKGLIAALNAVSSAEMVGDTSVLTAALEKNRSAISWAVDHPVPACADPRGYWDVLLMHVTAAAAHVDSTSSMSAAMYGVPKIDHELMTELKGL